LYFCLYNLEFGKYFGSLFAIYFLFTKVFFNQNMIRSSKLNFMMSMWTFPSDPTIYVRYEWDITKILEKLSTVSQKLGQKVGLTALYTKLLGNLLKEFTLCNSVIIFGKVRILYLYIILN
jgi:hypothetical protein